MPKFVALLRGINVGGKNKLPMRTLVKLFTAAGCCEVSTFIQSGNVIFDASAAVAAAASARVSAAIAKELGLSVPVVSRSAAEMARVPERNPFRGKEDTLHVMFLRDTPAKAAVAALDHARSPGDEFTVVGADIYLFLPGGVGKSKLTNAYFDSRLATVSTIRNWRTVQKLIELSS